MENHSLPEYFKGNKSWLIHLKSPNIRSKIWSSLKCLNSIFGKFSHPFQVVNLISSHKYCRILGSSPIPILWNILFSISTVYRPPTFLKFARVIFGVRTFENILQNIYTPVIRLHLFPRLLILYYKPIFQGPQAFLKIVLGHLGKFLHFVRIFLLI